MTRTSFSLKQMAMPFALASRMSCLPSVFITAISSSPSPSVSARMPAFLRRIEACQFQPLDSAVLRDEDEIVLVEFMHGDARRDLLARLEGQDVDQIRALGGASGLRDLIALAAVDLAEVREEEDIVMRGGGKDALDEVLLLRRHARSRRGRRASGCGRSTPGRACSSPRGRA